MMLKRLPLLALSVLIILSVGCDADPDTPVGVASGLDRPPLWGGLRVPERNALRRGRDPRRPLVHVGQRDPRLRGLIPPLSVSG